MNLQKRDDIPCRLCLSPSKYRFHGTLLGRFFTNYYQCSDCHLLQTDLPTWLDEAYSEAISSLDTGALWRVQFSSRLVDFILTVVSIGKSDTNTKTCLDFGGGPGSLTRQMRDWGYNFFHFDRYSSNAYAKGFEGDIQQKHHIVTAFEVFEHLVDVKDSVDEIFKAGHAFIFIGTNLEENPRHDWWYLLPETGQHVCFYTPNTVQWIAKKYGYGSMIGKEYALFVKHPEDLSFVQRNLLKVAIKRPSIAVRSSKLRDLSSKRRSKLWSDHLLLKERIKLKQNLDQNHTKT